ncbi:Putative LOC101896609, partial [Caligus rogercresseyi]
VSLESLEALLSSLNQVAVLFYDASSRKADLLLETMEKIDDGSKGKGVTFVKLNAEVGNEDITKKYGVESLPTLVFFTQQIPNVFD